MTVYSLLMTVYAPVPLLHHHYIIIITSLYYNIAVVSGELEKIFLQISLHLEYHDTVKYLCFKVLMILILIILMKTSL